MKRVVFAKIPSSEAGPIIRDLMGREMVDIHAKIGKDQEQVFKTLVTEAPGPEYFVFVIHIPLPQYLM